MLKTLFRITLVVVVLTFFAFYLLYASDSSSSDHGPHDKLNHALRLETNAERKAQKEFDKLQTINRIVGDLALAYSAKSEAIAKGKSVTIAAAIGAIGSIALTGGATLPTVAGLIGAASSLNLSWTGSDNLLHRYDEALKMKIDQITTLKTVIKEYNDVYWNKYYKERSNHLNSVTTHNAMHHSPVLTQWTRTPDYSLPSFLCGGSCGNTYNSPLGEHGEVCGAKKRDDSSVPPGCFDVWYTCVEKDVKKHSPIQCTLPYKIYRLVNGKKELIGTGICPDKFRRCVTFDLGYHEAVYYMYIDQNGYYQYYMPYGKKKIRYGQHKEHQHKPKKKTEGSETAQTPSTPETAVQNNAAPGDGQTIVCDIQGCTLTAAYDPSDTSAAALHAYCDSCYLYKCNGSDHSAASCSISGHQVCDNNSHVAADCGHSSHYVCDSLTHVEEQCTNVSNGVRCTYQFWRCLHPSVPSYGPSHTCDYSVSCGRSGCTQTVTSSTQHSATCANGHSYWTCNPSEVYHHITRTCKYSACGKSWERCSTVGGTPVCDLPWRKSKGWSCWW